MWGVHDTLLLPNHPVIQSGVGPWIDNLRLDYLRFPLYFPRYLTSLLTNVMEGIEEGPATYGTAGAPVPAEQCAPGAQSYGCCRLLGHHDIHLLQHRR